MYRPDELLDAHMEAETPKSGRHWYHGKHELVASNHLDVVDITSMAGPASVAQWVEDDDDSTQEGYYWRQTFNVKSGGLSVCTPTNKECLSDFELATEYSEVLHLRKLLQSRLHSTCLPRRRMPSLDA